MVSLRCASFAFLTLIAATSARAQTPAAQNPPAAPPAEHVHDMEHMDMPMDEGAGKGWTLMQDGNVWLLFNNQGGPRGGHEFKVPNWWMGMANRPLGKGTLTLHGMFSLDPATVGARGYRELFQVGEAYDGKPITDRQHPHDLWMQLSATWRVPLNARTAVTVSGGPASDPALGPEAFMHRASAAALPLAPLTHHTFDSTHVAFGVATVGVQHGAVTVEASAFNGREPDQHRWDFDFGRMDSLSARVTVRASTRWSAQLSTGHLVAPEQLAHGNVERTTGSVSYLGGAPERVLAVTVGAGANHTHDATRRAAFVEASRWWGPQVMSLRAEVLELESALLLTGEEPVSDEDEARKDLVGAFTLSGLRRVGAVGKLTLSAGASATWFAVPSAFQATHGKHPASFQVMLQIKPAAPAHSHMSHAMN